LSSTRVHLPRTPKLPCRLASFPRDQGCGSVTPACALGVAKLKNFVSLHPVNARHSPRECCQEPPSRASPTLRRRSITDTFSHFFRLHAQDLVCSSTSLTEVLDRAQAGGMAHRAWNYLRNDRRPLRTSSTDFRSSHLQTLDGTLTGTGKICTTQDNRVPWRVGQ
jgi:hypothetical protein